MRERIRYYRDESDVADQVFFAYLIGQIDLHRERRDTMASRSKFVTVVEILEDDDEVVSTGWAFCSPEDNPSRARGRAIARGRAKKWL